MKLCKRTVSFDCYEAYAIYNVLISALSNLDDSISHHDRAIIEPLLPDLFIQLELSHA